MAESYDVVVIGSGFGGAITAARLAEKGYRVLILERGRRWTPDTFPRKPKDPWLWDHRKPEQCHGWFDFRVYPHMSVVQGAGVGGGSLVYANISIDAKPDTFNAGWPPEITFKELTPYYQAVGAMLNVQKVPVNQWPERTKLVKEAAEKLHYGDRFRPLDLAVTFDPDWHYDLPDPHNESHSKTFTNAQGILQATSKVIPPPGYALEDTVVLLKLAAALGAGLTMKTAADVRADLATMAAQVPGLAGIDRVAFAEVKAASHWLESSNPMERGKWDVLFNDLPPVKFAETLQRRPAGKVIPLVETK